MTRVDFYQVMFVVIGLTLVVAVCLLAFMLYRLYSS